MKKLVKILALVLVSVTVATLFTACAPNKDPKKAQSNLKDEGYVVSLVDSSIALSGVSLALGAESGDITAFLTAAKTDDNDNVQSLTVIYFKDNKTAKNYMKKAKEYMESDSEDEDSDLIFEQSGNMVYLGTKDAIKASR